VVFLSLRAASISVAAAGLGRTDIRSEHWWRGAGSTGRRTVLIEVGAVVRWRAANLLKTSIILCRQVVADDGIGQALTQFRSEDRLRILAGTEQY
jgi:hypothetical protein